ncbi:GNAT family N-acetyltransferase [Endozoicomonas sp. 4G]|uniref:GNAT family N-acetyltransferase n=1 Tax=Endozoicomonas sp. 4G TaxID=2872754 RepID=UPI0020789900|nr:GNAT family N-acetyltransferase [Endozoicomonas sp. 4G]
MPPTLPSGQYRLVDRNNRTEVDLWHHYEGLICDDNFGETPSNPWYEPEWADEATKRFFLKGHLAHTRRYGRHFHRYFILHDSQIVGSFAVKKDSSGVSYLLVESLYVQPEFRRQGLADQALNAIYEQACAAGLDGIKLQTEYSWKPAINFYLHNGYWLLHWNPCLNFVRSRQFPDYQVTHAGEWLSLSVQDKTDYTPLLSAKKNGDTLQWKVHEYAREVSEDLLVTAETTFSLHLDVLGWPLKRSGHHNHYCGDCGGPEALAAQIEWWNAPL